jgi:hypothetical protein
VKDFSYQFETPKAPTEVLGECLAEWNGQLSGHGYNLTTQSEFGLTYLCRYRPWWLVFPCVLLFPLGLLALIYTEEAQITATVNRDENGTTHLSVTGRAPKKVREGFANLEVR